MYVYYTIFSGVIGLQPMLSGAALAGDCFSMYAERRANPGDSCSVGVPGYGVLTGTLQSYTVNPATGVYTAVVSIAGVGTADVTLDPSRTSPDGVTVDGCTFAVGSYAGRVMGTITPLPGASCYAPQSSNPASKNAALNGAAAASQLSVMLDVQNSVLDSVTRKSDSEKQEEASRNSGRSASGAPATGIFSSGRVRGISHDAYRGDGVDPAIPRTSFNSSEASAFGSAFLILPNTVWGGQVQLGFFQGYGQTNVGAEGGANGANESIFVGGYSVYTANSNYAMLTLAGNYGRSQQSFNYYNIFGNLLLQNQSYETSGVGGALVAGHVFTLSGGPAPSAKDGPASDGQLKLDLRAGAAYQYFVGANSETAFGSVHPYLHAWIGSGSATLFTVFSGGDGGLFKPYIKGEVRHELDYENAVRQITPCVGTSTYSFYENATMGVAEGGFDYVWPRVSFNAAVYGEFAGDQSAIGGRMGLKFKLN